MDPSFQIEVEALAASLDQIDYFGILKLASTATPAEIKEAYHRESRIYHPDRFATVPDARLRDLVGRIYRRVNEAYTVLRDDARRRKYLGDISGPDRERKLRFTEEDEVEVKEERKRRLEEQMGQTPNGRKFFASALSEAQAGRWEAAERNLKMALAYEPTNPRFLQEMEQLLKSRPKADFRIK
jgi:curved DNA-binding protein CbpA